jgi:hypothetical protein
VVLVLASRILAAPGSPFLEQAAYVMAVPAAEAEALGAAAGEALRNVTAHAGVRHAAVTARGDGSGGVGGHLSPGPLGLDTEDSAKTIERRGGWNQCGVP